MARRRCQTEELAEPISIGSLVLLEEGSTCPWCVLQLIGPRLGIVLGERPIE